MNVFIGVICAPRRKLFMACVTPVGRYVNGGIQSLGRQFTSHGFKLC